MELENLNKKKIIFIILWVIILILILIIFWSLNWWKTNKTTWTNKLIIWWFWDNKEKLFQFVQDFKNDTGHKSLTVDVETFHSWQDYNLALASAISSWKAPDIFVLNSSEDSIFKNQTMALDPKAFDPDTFRNAYKEFIWDKLIDSVVLDKKTWKKKSFVLGIPVWYEQLWIYYNRFKWIQASDFKSWAALNQRIQIIKENRPSIVPLWIWKWKTVVHSDDIITQFLMLNWLNSINNIDEAKLKSALSTYFMYGDSKVNGYDQKDQFMKSSNKTNFDLFSRWEIAMVVWYPRDLLKIDENGFRKSWLYVQPFPWYFDWIGKSFVKFNYFVVNKDSKNISVDMDFMKYIASDSWASKYLKLFTYYLPAKISLEQDFLDSKILDWYHIKLKDFINSNLQQSIFDKWLKMIYDKKIVEVLDNKVNYIDQFLKMRSKLVCEVKKIIKLEDLSVNCDK